MKKIEQEIYQTIKQHNYLNKANTVIYPTLDGMYIKLHGNKIVNLQDNLLTLHDCGYPTRLTTSRLNVILQALGLSIKVKVKQGKTHYYLKDHLLGTTHIEIPYFR